MNVSVLVPSLWRVDRMRQVVQNIVDTRAGHDVEIVVVAGDDDTARACEALPVVCVRGGDCAVEAYNLGAVHATREWIMAAADDIALKPGWLDQCEAVPNTGYVGLYEFEARCCGHFMVTRRFIVDVLGGALFPPVYRSWFADLEVCWRVNQAGRFARTEGIPLVHLHYSLGLAPVDENYKRGERWHKQDSITFARRQMDGFPITWAPMIQEDHAYTR